MKQVGFLKVWLLSGLIFSAITACQNVTPTPAPTPALGGVYNNQGYQHVLSGELEQALQDFKQATAVEPGNAEYWNNLCWFGSLAGHAAEAIDACSQGVELDPEAGYIRDSRGLALALTGDYERAINDFKYFVNWSKEYRQFEHLRPRREAWLSELEAGRNPFNEATLRELLTEE